MPVARIAEVFSRTEVDAIEKRVVMGQRSALRLDGGKFVRCDIVAIRAVRGRPSGAISKSKANRLPVVRYRISSVAGSIRASQVLRLCSIRA